nr:hypothetical protein [Nostoc commune]
MITQTNLITSERQLAEIQPKQANLIAFETVITSFTSKRVITVTCPEVSSTLFELVENKATA